MEVERFVFQSDNTRVIVAGSSATGKTEFVKKVIEHRHSIFESVPNRIVWVYKYKPQFSELYPFIEFTEEVPTHFQPNEKTLVICDDLICSKQSLKQTADLFVRGRHAGVSLFFITQNLFLNDPSYRLISLNATHYVLFKSVRSAAQIQTLGRQIFNSKELPQFVQAFSEATQNPYDYLLVDLTPTQKHRLRGQIFDEEQAVYVLE
jgi:hypothetical protein